MNETQERDATVHDFPHAGHRMGDRLIGIVLRYWERLRAGRTAPMRSELDPRQIEDALENTLILERTAPGHVRIRLAGMHLSELMGMEVRGMTPDALIEPNDRAAFMTLLEGIFERPEIIEIDLVSRPRARLPLRARMLLLPMQSDLGEMNRALGCLVTEGIVGAPPRRFEIAGRRITRISEHEAPRETVPGFAEAPAPLSGMPLRSVPGGSGTKKPEPGKRPWLRLVKNDED